MADVSYNIIDKINLEDLCKIIGDFLSSHGIKTYSIYGESYDVTTPTILACGIIGCSKSENAQIKKIFKGETAPDANKQIRYLVSYPDEAREMIMLSCSGLEQLIRKQKEAGIALLGRLRSYCNQLYFTTEELKEIDCAYKKFSENCCFLGLLFLHALFRVSINLPVRMAKRIFNEALTLHPTNPMRNKLLKCAAEYKHEYATLMYANEVYSNQPNYAFDLFLSLFIKDSPKAEISSNALWEVAFLIENHKLDSTQKELVCKLLNIEHKFRSVINKRADANNTDLGDPDMECIGTPLRPDSRERDLLLGHTLTKAEIEHGRAYMKNEDKELAYMIYMYIAKRDLSFPKALNSLGKLLLGDYILDLDKVPQTVIPYEQLSLALSYLRLAVSFGNTNAMVNIAIFYYNQHKLRLAGKPSVDISDLQIEEMYRMFQVAADLDEASARYYIGELLIEKGEYNKAIKYLEFSEGNISPKGLYQLGKLYSDSDTEKAIKYFRQAISGDLYDAAYDLAMLRIRQYNDLGPVKGITFLQEAEHLLQKYSSQMSKDKSAKAKKLIASWKKLL